MRFRPCIDLHEGRVKQIVGSTFSDNDTRGIITNFETQQSPAYFAQLYKKDSLGGGHVIMLGPGNEAAAKEALAVYPGGFHVGGGITPENAQDFLTAGASHVIVTSYVFKNGTIYWENLSRLVEKVGTPRLVIDLSCKKKDDQYYIVTDRWQNFTTVALTRETLQHLATCCDEFLVHAADIEGRQEGIDVALVTLLADCSPIPVTYAGGIHSLEDLDTIYENGHGRIDATVGSALDIFGGTLRYEEVVAWHKKHQ